MTEFLCYTVLCLLENGCSRHESATMMGDHDGQTRNGTNTYDAKIGRERSVRHAFCLAQAVR